MRSLLHCYCLPYRSWCSCSAVTWRCSQRCRQLRHSHHAAWLGVTGGNTWTSVPSQRGHNEQPSTLAFRIADSCAGACMLNSPHGLLRRGLVVGAGGIPCRRVGPRIDDLPPGVVRWCKEDADAHVVVGKRRERLTVAVAVYLVVELETALGRAARTSYLADGRRNSTVMRRTQSGRGNSRVNAPGRRECASGLFLIAMTPGRT